MCVYGPAQSVAHGTIEISTQVETFWPRGSRLLPVEEVSDLSGRKLERATPNEAGKPVREDWKPLPAEAWGDVTEQSWVYQETIEKGLHQGLQTARQAAIGIVAARFPEIEQFAREIIETISDPNRLQTLIVELSIAPSQERAKELLLSFVSAS
jgi:hypothetical protein